MSGAEARYLAAVERLRVAGKPATVSALSRDLGLSKASVSSARPPGRRRPRRTRASRGAAVLTDRGASAAGALAARRAVVERFLAEVLGVGSEHLAGEADRLAQVVSPRLEQRMRIALNGRVPPSAPS